MTIFQSKSNQQGDSDDPPPKKKLKKSKNLIRSQVQSHALSHPTTSSAPGPSQHHNGTFSNSELSIGKGVGKKLA